jgi:hypothetical protein
VSPYRCSGPILKRRSPFRTSQPSLVTLARRCSAHASRSVCVASTLTNHSPTQQQAPPHPGGSTRPRANLHESLDTCYTMLMRNAARQTCPACDSQRVLEGESGLCARCATTVTGRDGRVARAGPRERSSAAALRATTARRATVRCDRRASSDKRPAQTPGVRCLTGVDVHWASTPKELAASPLWVNPERLRRRDWSSPRGRRWLRPHWPPCPSNAECRDRCADR